jgi:ubiquinone/menaquinone biosynthesis C-methylase UbiE
MKEESRWEKAQGYEKNWWQKRASSIDFEFYKSFADELINFTKNDFTITSETKILEIGSGAGGIITFLTTSNHRFAIDPLEEFYSSQKQFTEQRDSSVIYKNEKGESLSFSDNYFDLLIMDNVLDHCENPKLVFEEAKRVLKKGGFIYFKQNTYHIWGKLIRSIMEFFVIDKGHPFTFLKSDLQKLVNESNFIVLSKHNNGYFKTWKKEFSSNFAKDKIKALLFVTRDKVTCLLKK